MNIDTDKIIQQYAKEYNLNIDDLDSLDKASIIFNYIVEFYKDL